AESRNWLGKRLMRQCCLTAPIVEQGTQGELLWDDQIEFKESIDKYGVRRQLPPSALHELRRQLRAADMINRDELVAELKDEIKLRGRFRIIEIIDQSDSDLGVLFDWLKAACDCDGVIAIHISFEFAVGHSPLGVLRRIRQALSQAGQSCPRFDSSPTARLEALFACLLEDLAALPQ